MVDTCGLVRTTFADNIAGSGLAHTVTLTETAVLKILSEILGQLTSFVSVLIIDLRILLVDIGVALILVLGGYPRKLSGLQVTNLVEGTKVSIDVLYWCRLRVLIADKVTDRCITADGRTSY